jgi:hypothetical protein
MRACWHWYRKNAGNFAAVFALAFLIANLTLTVSIHAPARERLTHLGLSLGLGLAALLSFAVAAVGWVERARRRRRGERNQCPRCGYDVRATPAQCPECGSVIEGES